MRNVRNMFLQIIEIKKERRNMSSDQFDIRQLDTTYHSGTHFRWKYVSEMASSVYYDAFANMPERLAKHSIVVVTSVCGYYNRHDCKSESTDDYAFARLQIFPKMNATYRYSIFVIVRIKLIAALGLSYMCHAYIYIYIYTRFIFNNSNNKRIN